MRFGGNLFFNNLAKILFSDFLNVPMYKHTYFTLSCVPKKAKKNIQPNVIRLQYL